MNESSKSNNVVEWVVVIPRKVGEEAVRVQLVVQAKIDLRRDSIHRLDRNDRQRIIVMLNTTMKRTLITMEVGVDIESAKPRVKGRLLDGDNHRGLHSIVVVCSECEQFQ